MRTIFSDPALQSSFENDGYVIVPFLDARQVSELESAYHLLAKESDLKKGWHATIHSANPGYKKKVSEAICSVFTPLTGKYIKDYNEVFANFTVKEPDPEASQFDLHMDWSMVDETRFISLTVWSPLIDITDENGYLWVLKGSHKLGYTIRGGPGLQTWSENVFDPLNMPQYERVVLKLKAGEALIYDHRLIHGSPANKSDSIRIAVNYTMVPKETASWHYHFHSEDEMEIFEAGPEFYNSHPIMDYPESYPSLGRKQIEKGTFLNQWDLNAFC